MSLLSTCIRQVVLVMLLVIGWCCAGTGPVHAQSLESALMPGKVIKGHADIEDDCKRCHVRFDRAAQTTLCLGCHKEVAADVRAKSGHHGRVKERECRACHTDHKGRDANIVKLDERGFDHAFTDFPLAGKHRGVTCASCHKPGAKHRNATQECAGCHRKDDRHKGNLGAKCETCHNERSWKHARFDHQKTRFPLANKHAETKCGECHAGERYTGTARDCASCHRKDDAHKGHFGTRCESCHGDDKWKTPSFRHDRDTRFVLRDRHRAVKCESCHRAPLFKEKTPSNCVSCHRADDPHKGSLGQKCESCHNESRWKGSRFDHDRETRFPLRDKHRVAKCESCHKDAAYREKPPGTCVGCHAADDRDKGHKGNNGDKCETCHVERSWRDTSFDHERLARFPLRAKHREIKCEACHTGPVYVKKLETRCFACHEKDDRHKGQLGADCASCHNERDWHKTVFDHAKSAFPLSGRHATVQCAKCHLAPTFKDAKTDCVSCHQRDDSHGGRFGNRCDQCHTSATWKLPDFDHDRHTRFKLEGVHAKVKCHECHTPPARNRASGDGAPVIPAGRDLGPAPGTDCYSCHKKDDVHFESFGRDCERCHVPQTWRKVTQRPAVQGSRHWPLLMGMMR